MCIYDWSVTQLGSHVQQHFHLIVSRAAVKIVEVAFRISYTLTWRRGWEGGQGMLREVVWGWLELVVKNVGKFPRQPPCAFRINYTFDSVWGVGVGGSGRGKKFREVVLSWGWVDGTWVSFVVVEVVYREYCCPLYYILYDSVYMSFVPRFGSASCPWWGGPWSDERLERGAPDSEGASHRHSCCQGLPRQNSVQGMPTTVYKKQ